MQTILICAIEVALVIWPYYMGPKGVLVSALMWWGYTEVRDQFGSNCYVNILCLDTTSASAYTQGKKTGCLMICNVKLIKMGRTKLCWIFAHISSPGTIWKGNPWPSVPPQTASWAYSCTGGGMPPGHTQFLHLRNLWHISIWNAIALRLSLLWAINFSQALSINSSIMNREGYRMDLIRKQLFKWALSYIKCSTSFWYCGQTVSSW